ncbi:MAG TPA: hypothetical protein VLA91_11355 [Acidimicrobiia bacterium]|nr:hypothetical protein [Acidimicrobiia bacterium]
MFAFAFKIGHELRPRQPTVLRLDMEPGGASSRVFLDPDGLVDGIPGEAVLLTWDVPLSTSGIPAEGEVVAIDPRSATTPSEDAGRARRSGCLGALLRLIVPGGRSRLTEHRLRGLRPVILNGLPLLELTEPRASVTLTLPAEQRQTLRLFGIVQDSNGTSLYHVMEESGGGMVGGFSLEVGRCRDARLQRT